VRRPLSAHSVITRGWVVAASLATTAAVFSLGGSATAFPQPTIAQVEHKLSVINNRAARLGQDYDVVLQELVLAKQRLKLLGQETKRYRASFDAIRKQIDRIAIVAYEQGSVDSPLALLTSRTPQQVLNSSSILSELSAIDSAQISQYLAASHQLLNAQATAARTKLGILHLKQSLGKRLQTLNRLKNQELALLASLTPVQRVIVAPGGGTGGKPPPYKGPTGTQADAAVQYAYSKIGCPYVYGATGPCGAGYDCSGLTMSAWAYAGITIPRVSYDQMSQLPPVSLKNLQPGDILGFAGNSHVGIYVGGGYLIDAPVPGASVEKVALSGWYLSSLDGAVRP